jgi:hypothetical protein
MWIHMTLFFKPFFFKKYNFSFFQGGTFFIKKIMEQEPSLEKSKNNQYSLLSDEVRISIKGWMDKPILEQTSDVAKAVAPDFSPIFIVLFILASYFHEAYPFHFAFLASVWVLLQLYNYVMDPDFRLEIVNRLFTLLVYILVYLSCGIVWSCCKLYIDIWQGQMSENVQILVMRCYDVSGANGCGLGVLNLIKWDLTRSVTAFPISMVYTLSRDPLKLLNGFLYDLLFDTYVSIMMAAAQAHDQGNLKKETPINLRRLILYIVLYPVIGYAWSHVKLYLDVRRQHIPKRLNDNDSSNFLHRIRNLLLQWIIFWPISVLHTLLRDPVALFCDFVLHISKRSYIFVIERARSKLD